MALRIAAETKESISNILRLRVEDIERENNIIILRNYNGYEKRIVITKSLMREITKYIFEEMGLLAKEFLFFTDRDISIGSKRRLLKKILKKNGKYIDFGKIKGSS